MQIFDFVSSMPPKPVKDTHLYELLKFACMSYVNRIIATSNVKIFISTYGLLDQNYFKVLRAYLNFTAEEIKKKT
jgi:hypothetical protein